MHYALKEGHVDGSGELPDIEQLISVIKAEAARRRPSLLDTAEDRAARSEIKTVMAVQARSAKPFYTLKTARHVRDLFPLHGPDFVTAVFRTVLHREPDPTALGHYVSGMAQGRWSRSEVLCSIRLSPEGRRSASLLTGFWPLLALTAVFRVPLIGWLTGHLASILGLPLHLRNTREQDCAMLACINALR